MLFNELTIRKLNNLSMIATKVRAGSIKGERRSTKRGTSIEFADYRDYAAGDDLRRLDWNIYGRLDRPFIKLLEEEEDLAVYILVDISRSMCWGEGEANKLRYALHLAGALGVIALSAGDRANVMLLKETILPAQFGPSRGQQYQFQMLDFLEKTYQANHKNGDNYETDLNNCLRNFTFLQKRTGLVFVLSDMFSPPGFESGLSDLAGHGFETVVLHLLSPDESEPTFTGDISLLDEETGENMDVSIDAGIQDAYRKRVTLWKEMINQGCLRRNIRYLDISTEIPWEKIILHQMRSSNILK